MKVVRKVHFAFALTVVAFLSGCASVPEIAPTRGGTPTGLILDYGYEIGLPDSNWRLVVDLPGFVLKDLAIRDDQQGKRMMAMKMDEVEQAIYIVSIYLQREPISSAAEYRDADLALHLGASNQEITDIRKSESGPMAVYEYTSAYKIGKTIGGYLVRDGVAVKVIVSVAQEPSITWTVDQTLWVILRSVRYKSK